MYLTILEILVLLEWSQNATVWCFVKISHREHLKGLGQRRHLTGEAFYSTSGTATVLGIKWRFRIKFPFFLFNLFLYVLFLSMPLYYCVLKGLFLTLAVFEVIKYYCYLIGNFHLGSKQTAEWLSFMGASFFFIFVNVNFSYIKNISKNKHTICIYIF